MFVCFVAEGREGVGEGWLSLENRSSEEMCIQLLGIVEHERARGQEMLCICV